jgi:hypothetical protein
LRGLEGHVLEQLSLRAAEQWRLGDQRRDDGLLVVVAVKERGVHIEVGHGREGVVTDALASRVIRDVMAPRFARGEIGGAPRARCRRDQATSLFHETLHDTGCSWSVVTRSGVLARRRG